MAKEWAVGPEKNGYANIYDLEMDGLRVMDLNDPEFCILHWLTILLNNREFEMTSVLAREAKEYLTAFFLPDTAKEKPLQGTVVAVGQGTKDEEMVLKVGDTVLYGKYAGTELEFEGVKYLIMRQSDVLAILG